VEKSKAMVLAGTDPPELPTVTMYGEALEWVREFKYLGCPIYANNKPHKCLPLVSHQPSKSWAPWPLSSCLTPCLTFPSSKGLNLLW